MRKKRKKILITAGPTWVAIDKVRVISNTATGETGISLAEALAKAGCKVTLLLGPVPSCCLDKRIKVLNYKFFEELKVKLIRELKRGSYDIVIHSAAVSDYQLERPFAGKVRSGIKSLCLSLKPTEKIICGIKKIDPEIFLVGFKFEPYADKDRLVREARSLISVSGADLVVANTSKNGYKAYLVGREKCYAGYSNKRNCVRGLAKLIARET